MTEHQTKLMEEMREHLGKLHEKWQKDPECDGYCKSNEGYIGVLYRYGNWFDCDRDKEKYTSAKPVLSMIEVYSYLFGPHRLHTFETVEEAHKEVMGWS